MKNKAWTLTELVVALVVVTVLSILAVSTIKPTTQNSKTFIYASIRNLQRGNSWISENYGYFNGADVSGNDWYCFQIANIFNVKEFNCAITALGSTTVNIEFDNKTTIQGLASPWVSPYENSPYQFKNIVIDIDGKKGLNKVWIDRFPLRIYRGGDKDGLITPANCGSTYDYVYKTDGTKVTLSSLNTGMSQYCKHGFTSSGAAVSKRFVDDNSIISYDIVRTNSDEEASAGIVVKMGISNIGADCIAAAGDGFYSYTDCSDAGYNLHQECATKDACLDCDTRGNCPSGATNYAECVALADKYNPNYYECISVLHKPNVGMSIMLDGILGELDTDY